jgi:DNA replication protein DnaC
MLINQTMEKLKSLRLHGMASCLLSQAGEPSAAGLSFEERLGLLVDYEFTYRDNKRLQKLLKDARLKIDACLEDIDYRPSRMLDRSLVNNLKNCQWVELNQNILISGPTGTGKTYLACAFGSEACRRGFKTRYVRLTRLLQELSMARGEGNIMKFLDKLQKTDLLILDDWGHKKLTPPECRDLLEVIDDRSKCSTIVASQLPLEKWHSSLEDPTMADAILDRLIHNAHKFFIAGDSMRKIKNSIVIQEHL